MRFIFLVLALWHFNLLAQPVIELNAILGKQVIVTIDGEQVKLREGQTTATGLKLAAVTRKSASFEWEGQTFTVEPSSRVGSQFAETNVRKVITINRDNMGHYLIKGEINGYPVEFVVDTGASDVSMTSVQADRIGLQWEKGPRVMYSTANGNVAAHTVSLDRVTIAGVTVNLVDGSVGPAKNNRPVLLGMSFLKHFDMSESNNTLTLTRKY